MIVYHCVRVNKPLGSKQEAVYWNREYCKYILCAQLNKIKRIFRAQVLTWKNFIWDHCLQIKSNLYLDCFDIGLLVFHSLKNTWIANCNLQDVQGNHCQGSYWSQNWCRTHRFVMQNRYDISKLWRCSILQIVQSQKLSIKVSPNAKKVVHIQKSLLAPQYKVIPWSVIDRYIMVQEPGALTYFLKDKIWCFK